MPASAEGLLILLTAVAPGWMALLGWHLARGSRRPPLGEAVLTACALSAAWSGLLALLIGEPIIARWSDAPTETRALIWLLASGMAFGAPFALAWLGATAMARRRVANEVVTVLLRNETVVFGRLARDSPPGTVRVNDATVSLDGRTWTTAVAEFADSDVYLVLRDKERRGSPARRRQGDERTSSRRR